MNGKENKTQQRAKKNKDTSFLNIDDSQLHGAETGTTLCPLHHIRQCLKRKNQGAQAPNPSQHLVPTGN